MGQSNGIPDSETAESPSLPFGSGDSSAIAIAEKYGFTVDTVQAALDEMPESLHDNPAAVAAKVREMRGGGEKKRK